MSAFIEYVFADMKDEEKSLFFTIGAGVFYHVKKVLPLLMRISAVVDHSSGIYTIYLVVCDLNRTGDVLLDGWLKKQLGQ